MKIAKSDIKMIAYNFTGTNPVQFVTLSADGARKVREACNMKRESGPYFDPASNSKSTE